MYIHYWSSELAFPSYSLNLLSKCDFFIDLSRFVFQLQNLRNRNPSAGGPVAPKDGKAALRERIVKRAAVEFQDGMCGILIREGHSHSTTFLITSPFCSWWINKEQVFIFSDSSLHLSLSFAGVQLIFLIVLIFSFYSSTNAVCLALWQ